LIRLTSVRPAMIRFMGSMLLPIICIVSPFRVGWRSPQGGGRTLLL
jgi:hypothetical protein